MFNIPSPLRREQVDAVIRIMTRWHHACEHLNNCHECGWKVECLDFRDKVFPKLEKARGLSH